ncbi:heterodisulfide reductase-related iron-sulfur binding cluster, partial [Brachybacterium hainanense]
GRGRTGAETTAVSLPACVHTMFGAEDGGIGASAALARLAERAGVRLAVPDDAAALCCGTPFSSKGMREAKEVMQARLRASLIDAAAAADSPLPVVVDAASCTEGVLGALAGTDIEVMDAITFTARHLLDRLEIRRRIGSVTVHPTCSTTQLGATGDLEAIARACAQEVVVPVDWGCCGYAGDRGMLHPELTASATRAEAAEVAQRPTDWYVSANRTCELGMRAATGRPYRHVLELLEHATR